MSRTAKIDPITILESSFALRNFSNHYPIFESVPIVIKAIRRTIDIEIRIKDNIEQ